MALNWTLLGNVEEARSRWCQKKSQCRRLMCFRYTVAENFNAVCHVKQLLPSLNAVAILDGFRKLSIVGFGQCLRPFLFELAKSVRCLPSVSLAANGRRVFDAASATSRINDFVNLVM